MGASTNTSRCQTWVRGESTRVALLSKVGELGRCLLLHFLLGALGGDFDLHGVLENELAHDGTEHDGDSEDDEANPVELLVLAEQGGQHESETCHELDEDVEGGTRGVLEGITHGVSVD